jgi:microsomal dipeptidase-like Zn-dependent dipeptidase
MFANMRAAGVERSVISSDLGQVDNPPPEDGLPLMVDRLLAAGFSEQEIQKMVVENTAALAHDAVSARRASALSG